MSISPYFYCTSDSTKVNYIFTYISIAASSFTLLINTYLVKFKYIPGTILGNEDARGIKFGPAHSPGREPDLPIIKMSNLCIHKDVIRKYLS